MWTAELLDLMEVTGKKTAHNVMVSLLPEIQSLFGICAALYLLYYLIDRGIIKQNAQVGEIVRLLISICIIDTFLRTTHIYDEWIFEPLFSGLRGLSSIFIKASRFTGLNGADTVKDLLNVLASEMKFVEDLAWAIAGDGGWRTFHYYFIWLIIYGLNFFLYFFYLSFVVEFIFGTMIFSVLAPIAITLLFFKSTKSIAASIIRIPLHGGVAMALGSVSLTFIFSIIRYSRKYVPIKDGQIAIDAGVWLYDGGFMFTVMSLALGILFLYKSHKIASAITGIDTGVAGNVAFAGAGATAKTMTSSPMAWGGRAAGRGAVNALSSTSRGESLVAGMSDTAKKIHSWGAKR